MGTRSRVTGADDASPAARGHVAPFEMMEQFEELGSPIEAFMRECCILGPGCTIEVGRLFQ